MHPRTHTRTPARTGMCVHMLSTPQPHHTVSHRGAQDDMAARVEADADANTDDSGPEAEELAKVCVFLPRNTNNVYVRCNVEFTVRVGPSMPV